CRARRPRRAPGPAGAAAAAPAAPAPPGSLPAADGSPPVPAPRSAPGPAPAARSSWRRAAATAASRRPPFQSAAHQAEMPAHAHQAPEEPEQHAEDDDDQDVLGPEEHEAAQYRRVAAEHRIAGVAERNRQHATEKALDGALEQEGAPDEPVGGPDQAHDVDLPRALEQRKPDRHPDDHHGHRGKDAADH